MKKIFKAISLIVIATIAVCCRVADASARNEDIREVSVQFLKTLYNGYPFVVSEKLEIYGVVTANDRYGSYSRTLVVDDETGGIEIKISADRLFSTYPIGMKVRIVCQGLTLGDYGGVVSLGSASDDPKYENGYIAKSDISVYVKPQGTVVEVKPFSVQIMEFTPLMVSRLVQIRDVQFVDSEIGLMWGAEDIAVDRHIVNKSGDTLIVRTPSSAIFASAKLPIYSGTIEGILGYFNNRYQLRVVYHKNVVMESPRF